MPTSQQSARQQSNNAAHNRQNRRNVAAMERSNAVPDRLRQEESWVEISSEPSSSSLSSIGEEIVTTGLRVSSAPNPRRRRRPAGPSQTTLGTRQRSTSSQEEYEESESEEDPVLALSTEHISPPVRISAQEIYDAESEEDDDENGTALGRRPDEPFTPQPNAFSHPPVSQAYRSSVPGSYFPRQNQQHTPSRPSSYPSRAPTREPSYNIHSRHVDHDAALRASLTTLLSCAAAARGLPKHPSSNTMSSEPMGLRIVPESEILGVSPSPGANHSRPLSPSRTRSSPSISSREAKDDTAVKRKAVQTKPHRAMKKKKGEMVEEAFISPTLLTWVMSAGVVVLVSVVGFGAGYVIGREVGRQEGLGAWNGTMAADAGCGREVVRSGSGGLKKFRWGGKVARSIVA
ncbi:hypothetical protein CJF32_00009701 [Rutstroemia sp. NJR-2017a WRK4]|nr:hypothetical protein CJF32_00009701 [Rutstroemia sp. NJR-2017a WRK4]